MVLHEKQKALGVGDVARVECRDEFSLARVQRRHVIRVVPTVPRRNAIQKPPGACEKMRTYMVRFAWLQMREGGDCTSVGRNPFEPTGKRRKHDCVVGTPRATSLVLNFTQRR